MRAEETKLPEEGMRCAGPDGVMEAGLSLVLRPGAPEPRDPTVWDPDRDRERRVQGGGVGFSKEGELYADGL